MASRSNEPSGPNWWWVDQRPYVNVGVTAAGTCETEKIGLKHMAVRGKEEDSAYKPDRNNIAPRPKGWKPSKTNVQTQHTAVGVAQPQSK